MSALSYSIEGAAETTGVSDGVIRNAIRAGHLPVHYPKGTRDGKPISKAVILHADLEAWIANSPSERP